MNTRNLWKSIGVLLFLCVFSVNTYALTDPSYNFVFNFTGECDDCAFNGSPTDIGFNPIGDGLTETVTATLVLNGAYLTADGFVDYRGGGDARFIYNGSSLINPFTLLDPFSFAHALLPNGQVQDGSTFSYSSSQNAATPEIGFNFPNFCTDLGQQVLNRGIESACTDVGLVDFLLDSTGNFSISGTLPFDVGTGGQLTPAVSAVPVPAAIWLFGTGLVGLIGLAKRKKTVLNLL